MINYELDGKVAVVTGRPPVSARRALTRWRDRRRRRLWDLKAEPLEAAETELQKYGSHTTAVVDVSDSSRVDAAMAAVVDAHGRLDIVVANAGIGGEQKPSAEYSADGWHQVIGVNLDGVFYTQRAAIRRCESTAADR